MKNYSMLIAGKKGQNVKREVRLRITKPFSPAERTPAPVHGREELSEEFLRLMLRLLAAAFLVVLVLSLLLRWRIGQEAAELEHLKTVNVEVRREHARLTVQRDELASKPRVAAAAAVRLNLQLPTEEQEHRLD